MQPIEYQMLTMCQRACPMGVEQRAFTKLYGELMKDTELSADKVVLALAKALCDGLEHGNWPQ